MYEPAMVPFLACGFISSTPKNIVKRSFEILSPSEASLLERITSDCYDAMPEAT
jgi:hypothetical protein